MKLRGVNSEALFSRRSPSQGSYVPSGPFWSYAINFRHATAAISMQSSRTGWFWKTCAAIFVSALLDIGTTSFIRLRMKDPHMKLAVLIEANDVALCSLRSLCHMNHNVSVSHSSDFSLKYPLGKVGRMEGARRLRYCYSQESHLGLNHVIAKHRWPETRKRLQNSWGRAHKVGFWKPTLAISRRLRLDRTEMPRPCVKNRWNAKYSWNADWNRMCGQT